MVGGVTGNHLGDPAHLGKIIGPGRSRSPPARWSTSSPRAAAARPAVAALYSCTEAASNGEEVDAEACDASLCSQAPLFSSARAAQGWLDTHPGGRAFPIREAWDLSAYRGYRDRMSALLDLKD